MKFYVILNFIKIMFPSTQKLTTRHIKSAQLNYEIFIFRFPAISRFYPSGSKTRDLIHSHRCRSSFMKNKNKI